MIGQLSEAPNWRSEEGRNEIVIGGLPPNDFVEWQGVSTQNHGVMAEMRKVRLRPQNWIIIAIARVSAQSYLTVARGQGGNAGLIQGGDEETTVLKDGPDFSIQHGHCSCKLKTQLLNPIGRQQLTVCITVPE